jgi:hypothetical protein
MAQWGGLATSLVRIKTLFLELPPNRLEEKRSHGKDIVLYSGAQTPSKKPHCLQPLLRLERCLQGQDINEAWVIHRAIDHWLAGSKDSRRDPMPALERGLRHARLITAKLRAKLIDPFFEKPFASEQDKNALWRNWDSVRDATRSIVHDAISDGAWNARSLRARLHHMLRRLSAKDTAQRWLDLLFKERSEVRYTQRRRLPLDICERLNLKHDVLRESYEDLLDIKVANTACDGGKIGVQIDLRVHARSDFEARTVGQRRVLALLSERYAQCVGGDDDAPVDLAVDLHERPDDERVEALDTNKDATVDRDADADCRRGLPGLTHVNSTNRQTSGAPLSGAGSVLQGQSAGVNSNRVGRARREVLDARRPGLHGEQRVMLAWMAMERLISGGKDSKGDVIASLSAAASLIQLRSEFARILRDARAGLWLATCLQPESESLRALIPIWIPDLPEVKRAQANPETAESVRRARVMDPMPHVDHEDALRILWKQRSNIPTLQAALEPLAPLASAGLFDFMVITDRFGDREHKSIGDGSELAKYFREVYEDISSFCAHVYEIRNRAAHGGGIIDRDHDPAAVEIYQRFIALAEPVLDSTERWVAEGMSLEQIWGLAIDRAQDLAELNFSETTDDFEFERQDRGATKSALGAQIKPPRSSEPKASKVQRELAPERLVELLAF